MNWQVVSAFLPLKTMRHSVVCLVLGLAAHPLWAVNYGSGLTDTQWRVEANPYFCKFIQPIPQYGEAVFFQQAGRALTFYMEPNRQLMALGQAALTVEAPSWRSSALTNELGYVRVLDRRISLRVEAQRARRLMAELNQGMAPTFTRQARFGGHSIRVQLSPVDFKRYYDNFLTCIAELLPVNFAQIERTSVNYPTDVDRLDSENQRVLDHLVTYVKADSRVLSLEVVGHADSTGTRYDNRRLSERRANRVTDYLVNQGIDPAIILTDYQGDRYPIASNDDLSGRAANRRTTILVRRIEDDPDDPLRGLPDFNAR